MFFYFLRRITCPSWRNRAGTEKAYLFCHATIHWGAYLVSPRGTVRNIDHPPRFCKFQRPCCTFSLAPTPLPLPGRFRVTFGFYSPHITSSCRLSPRLQLGSLHDTPWFISCAMMPELFSRHQHGHGLPLAHTSLLFMSYLPPCNRIILPLKTTATTISTSQNISTSSPPNKLILAFT